MKIKHLLLLALMAAFPIQVMAASPDTVLVDAAQHCYTGSTTENQVGSAYVIPGGTMGANGNLQIKAFFARGTASSLSSITFNIRAGNPTTGPIWYTGTIVSGGKNNTGTTTIWADGSTNAQKTAVGSTNNAPLLTSEDFTSAVNLYATVKVFNAADTGCIEGLELSVNP